MNTSDTQNKYRHTKYVVGNKAKDLVAFGRSQGWHFPVLGNAPIPNEPVLINEWLIVPAHLDRTTIPIHTRQKMDAIFAAGIFPDGWLVVHEAPKQLPESVNRIEDITPADWLTPKVRKNTKRILKASGAVLGTLALATGILTLAITAVAITLPALLIAGAVIVDPILVAVTEDGFWVEIDRWDI